MKDYPMAPALKLFDRMIKSAFQAAKAVTPRSVQNLFGTAYVAALRILPKRQAIRLRYFKSFQRLPNLSEPRLFSEKCQALKLSNPDLSRFVDKVAVKKLVTERIGPQYVIPTLYAGPRLPPVNERNWSLPYVVKTNHGSGGNIFVREAPDWPNIEAKLHQLMSYDFASVSGETFYNGYPRQVLVEPFIATGPQLPLDYKIFTCGGKVQFIQVDIDRETAHKRVFFDREWRRLPMRFGYPDDERPISRPKKLDLMLQIASKLARGIGFVRIDFYEVGERVYFGEMTFTPESGLMKFEPASVDAELGAKWPWPTAA